MEGIVGVFRSRLDAESAVRDLVRIGQPEDANHRPKTMIELHCEL